MKLVSRKKKKKKAVRRKKEANKSSSSSDFYRPGFAEEHPEVEWSGRRDSKTFTLTGDYSTIDLIDNFTKALEIGGAWGYYNAREWFSKLFSHDSYNSWPLSALLNYYRELYKKDAPNQHPFILQYLVYGKLSIRWLKEEVKREGAKEHSMYLTWKNMIPKIIERQKLVRKRQYHLMNSSTAYMVRSGIKQFDKEVYRRGDSTMAKKKVKKGKKVVSKKSKKRSGSETIGQSILAVGRKKRGVVTEKWIEEKVRDRREKAGLMKKKDKLYAWYPLQKLCEKGEMTKVGPGEYSFDGTKKSSTKKSSKKVLKKSPKKAVKKSPKKSPKKKKTPKKPKKAKKPKRKK